MSRYVALRELSLLRVRTFLREPEALFWTFVFPILMAIGLGIAFGGEGDAPVPVVMVQGSAAERHAAALEGSSDLELRRLPPAEAAASVEQPPAQAHSIRRGRKAASHACWSMRRSREARERRVRCRWRWIPNASRGRGTSTG